MTASRFLAVACTALLSAAALAQSAPVGPDPTVPAQPGPCIAQGARHDHGAEKGTPTPRMSGGCPMAVPTAAAVVKKPKGKPAHDHSKFHKLM
jgi:hypothetical protein